MNAGNRYEMGVALIAPRGPQLVEAASLLTLALFTDLDDVRLAEVREMNVSGQDANQLLEAWIRRLMALCEQDRFLFSRVHVKEDRGARTIQGEAWGERIDPARHRLHRAPGSVVLHEARIVQAKDAFRARLAFNMERKTP